MTKPNYIPGDFVRIKSSWMAKPSEEVFEVVEVYEGPSNNSRYMIMNIKTFAVVDSIPDYNLVRYKEELTFESLQEVDYTTYAQYPYHTQSDLLIDTYADYRRLYETFGDQEYLDRAEEVKLEWQTKPNTKYKGR